MAIKYGKKQNRKNNVLYTIVAAILLCMVFLSMVSYFYYAADDEAYENYNNVEFSDFNSDDKIIKAWAMIGSRADASALYFARSAHNMGDASTNTTWKSKAVAEVNKFKNYFDGQGEYLSSEGSIAYNERGTSGVVLVNAGGTSCSVNVRANKMANGTYTDYVTGNKFTVSNGRITGNIGDTGVAVVYNQNNTPVNPIEPPSTEEPSTEEPTKPTPQETYLCGDVDMDKKVTVMDATMIQQHLSMAIVLSAKGLQAADSDLDNSVDVTDATSIQMFLIGIKGNSHCGEYINGSVTPNPTPDPGPAPDGKRYVYYKDTNNWGNVNLYYWSDANTGMTSWPGVNMESVGNGVYRAALPSDVDYVIFNNGSAQTGDLKFEGFNKIYDNGSWSNYGGNVDPEPDPIPTPTPSGNFIYFNNAILAERYGKTKQSDAEK